MAYARRVLGDVASSMSPTVAPRHRSAGQRRGRHRARGGGTDRTIRYLVGHYGPPVMAESSSACAPLPLETRLPLSRSGPSEWWAAATGVPVDPIEQAVPRPAEAVADREKRRNRERPVHQAAVHRRGGASQQTRDVRQQEHIGQGVDVDGSDRRRIHDPRGRGHTKPVTARRRSGDGGTGVSGHGGRRRRGLSRNRTGCFYNSMLLRPWSTASAALVCVPSSVLGRGATGRAASMDTRPDGIHAAIVSPVRRRRGAARSKQ